MSDWTECLLTDGSCICEVAFFNVWKEGVRRVKEERRPDVLGIGLNDLLTRGTFGAGMSSSSGTIDRGSPL